MVWQSGVQEVSGFSERAHMYECVRAKTTELLFIVSVRRLLMEVFYTDLMKPILIILLNPTIKTYRPVHVEQYPGKTQTSTSNHSFCSCWQE